MSELPELLERALEALPGDSTHREIGLVAKTLLQSGDEETLALLENEEARKPLYEKAPEQQFVIMELGWLVGWVRDGALPLEGIENTFPIMSGG